MNNLVFFKTMENVRKHHDFKLDAKDERRNYLVLESAYNKTNWFSEELLAILKKQNQSYDV